MRLILRYLIFIACCVTGLSPAFACDHDDADGLDVGLVLSGGGAKASTQVGVMQIMEELDIPVHCIAGTSMGAVVGSLYANGYSADDIAGILTDNDWGKLFRGTVPRRNKSFVEKDREEDYFTGNVASYGADGLQLPGGLSSMQGLKSYYQRILADVPLDMDFDDLEIPFRAVATNLHKGQKKVFRRGDLVETILASMAVPGVFAPREIGGELYIDGGLASNLPIKAATDMGADIIIAVDVSVEPPRPKPNISVGAAANHITGIIIWQKVQDELNAYKGEILHLKPNAQIGITTAGYQRSKDGLAAGRKAGREAAEKLLDIKSRAAPMRRNSAAYKIAELPETLRIENNTAVSTEILRRRFDWARTDPENPEDQENRVRDIISFGGFGEVEIGRSAGEAVLEINRNPLGRNLVRMGLNASSDFNGSASYSILARLTRKPLGPRGGDLSLSGEFGTNFGLSAELYQPLGPKGRYFIQPELYATWKRQPLDIFDVRVADLWQRDVGLRGRLGRELGNWGVIAVQGEIINRHIRNIVETGIELPKNTFDIGAMGLYFGVDTLDRKDWPTSGQKIGAAATRVFNLTDTVEPEVDQVELYWLGAFDVKGYGALLNARHGRSPNRRSVSSGSFTLGGFRQLGAFSDNSIFTDEFSYLSLEVFDRITAQGRLLDFPAYVGVIGEFAEFPLNILDIDEDASVFAGSVYIGVDTPLGPAFFGGAYGSDDSSSLFFKFGRTF